MFKFSTLFFVFFFLGCSSEPKEDLTNVFGIHIGKAVPDVYLKTRTEEYPTRIISLDVKENDELNVFNSFIIQIIESNKAVYSIIAEKKYVSANDCNAAFQDLYLLLNEKYEHLKQTRELNVDGKVISADDGYKSSNGKYHLRFGCSIDDEGANNLNLTLWDVELKIEVDNLWSKFTANK
ncbi:hypothetical protein [Marinomonas posidonica]|uniref:Lipoprotein n=1 Tax=Marinomonas posidonica (strain CECT 7376 / NCIMB 14433 / IVIA-Po-181) TaxID=491952 RepID=F6CVA7_MARPP|nr:hypothetical protein [Marinomonas posidonica]AEF54217.1 hypothetical protein Mar181_1170 [Marinomonas posidonica IVIA-Po-181]